MLETLAVIAGLFAATLRGATPLLLVMLGETLTQRVGIINLGVEGQMLMGAFVGFATTAVTGDPWLGLAAGALAGFLLSTVHAMLCLGFRANQIGSGIAVWILGMGISSFYGRPFVGRDIPGLGTLVDRSAEGIPLLGPILTQLTPTVLIALLLVPVIGLWLGHTRDGLRWRAVGESTESARALGIRPTLVRIQGILVGGLLSGLGGAALSVDYTSTWAQEMTRGRGLVAVGLVIVARWNPYLALPAALLFGLAEAVYLRLQVADVSVSSYLLATLPYGISLLVLVLAYRRARRGGMPAALSEVFAGTR